MKLEKLFTPMKIGTCEIPNRLVVPAMVTNYNTGGDGKATEQYIAYHERKAQGGWGLIITENYAVNEHAMGYKYIGGLWNDDQIESHRRLTERIHRYDSRIFCQIYHAGRQSKHAVNGGVQPWAASPTCCPWLRDLPRELTVEEIHEIVRQFGDAALRAKKAGFDGVEIHSAHGYLLHGFLSPNTNKRTDEYGGNFDNRMRILGEVIADVRSKVGPDFPVTVRISAIEFVPGGRSGFESRTIFKQLEEWGVDAIHVSSGMYGNGGIISPMTHNHGWITQYAAEAKRLVHIPIITVNRINDPYQAEDILTEGMADFVAMGRGSLADPGLPNKAREGRLQDIRSCIACMQGCLGQLSLSDENCIRCLVNPELGYEFQTDHTPAAAPKRVFVAGGGPGGMEAAIAAAEKGHKVTLFEKGRELGGQFVSAAYPPYKGEFANFTAWQIREVKKLGVEVRLNTALTRETVEAEKPDRVIVATGVHHNIPNVPGIDDPRVKFAEDVLAGRVPSGDRVVIIGGGMVGTETAGMLTLQLRQVTLVEMLPEIATDMVVVNRVDSLKLLEENHVRILTNTKLNSVCENGVLLEKNGEVWLEPADCIVIAAGARKNDELARELEGTGVPVTVVGDAVQPRKAFEAVREGYAAGLSV